jgi:hypothetical protein
LPKSPSSISFYNIVRGKGWEYPQLGTAGMAVAGALFNMNELLRMRLETQNSEVIKNENISACY